MKYQKRPAHAPLDQWIHRTRSTLKSLRLSGSLRAPLEYIAGDRRAMYDFCQGQRGQQLNDILLWRSQEWLQSVPRHVRPNQRKGGDFIELRLLATDREKFSFLRRHAA